MITPSDKLTIEEVGDILFMFDKWEQPAIIEKLASQLVDTLRHVESLKIEIDFLDEKLRNYLRENKQLLKVLRDVDSAYCGVGDFEGTGKNMASVIVQVRQVLRNKESE